ncbi:MAG: hypothetical protein EU531_06065 [Promethearchaeota archaeon]|nr:MAG: hypothetical protein EU531_06065 [Candidatus Lokiarchaeota archaeon]
MITKVDENIIHFINEPLFLSQFTESDIYEFYVNNLKNFLENGNFTKIPDATFEDYFPLNHQLLEHIYHMNNGNPREILKILIKIFNEIIFSNQNLSKILEKYET